VKLVVVDSVIDSNRDGCNLWEVPRGKPGPAWASYNVVGRMLISVSSFFASSADDLKYGIDPEPRVRVYGCTFAIDNGEREVGWVDATREE
jgi:hypothetical protein